MSEHCEQLSLSRSIDRLKMNKSAIEVNETYLGPEKFAHKVFHSTEIPTGDDGASAAAAPSARPNLPRGTSAYLSSDLDKKHGFNASKTRNLISSRSHSGDSVSSGAGSATDLARTDSSINSSAVAAPAPKIIYAAETRGIRSGKREVSHASVEKLVENLTQPQNYNNLFRDAFILTYPSFCKTSELVSLLVWRYRAALSVLFPRVPRQRRANSAGDFTGITSASTPPPAPDHAIFLSDINTTAEANVVIVRIVNLLKYWIRDSGYLPRDLDSASQKLLLAFLNEILVTIDKPSLKQHAEIMIKAASVALMTRRHRGKRRGSNKGAKKVPRSSQQSTTNSTAITRTDTNTTTEATPSSKPINISVKGTNTELPAPPYRRTVSIDDDIRDDSSIRNAPSSGTGPPPIIRGITTGSVEEPSESRVVDGGKDGKLASVLPARSSSDSKTVPCSTKDGAQDDSSIKQLLSGTTPPPVIRGITTGSLEEPHVALPGTKDATAANAPASSSSKRSSSDATTIPSMNRGVTTGSLDRRKTQALKKNNGSGNSLMQSGVPVEKVKTQTKLGSRSQPLSGISAKETADQLTLIESEKYFCRIKGRELTNRAWTLETKRAEAPGVISMIELFDARAEWVSSEILHPKLQTVERAKMISFFVDVADYCRLLHNYNTLFEIVTGLNAPCINQLHTTWGLVNGSHLEKFQCLQQICSVEDNYKNYRQAFALSEGQPRLPCLFILAKDLFGFEESMKTIEHGLVHFRKFRKIHETIAAALDCQVLRYYARNSTATQKRGISLQIDDTIQAVLQHRLDTVRRTSTELFLLAKKANTQESILFVNSLSEAGFL